MSAHTPGPWKAVRDEVWAGRRRICAHVGAGESLGLAEEIERAKANARLIAAAPNMLAALQSVAPELHGLALLSNEAKRLSGIVAAAIASAKGEQ